MFSGSEFPLASMLRGGHIQATCSTSEADVVARLHYARTRGTIGEMHEDIRRRIDTLDERMN